MLTKDKVNLEVQCATFQRKKLIINNYNYHHSNNTNKENNY